MADVYYAPSVTVIIEGPWRLLIPRQRYVGQDMQVQLYHTIRDPGERDNLADSHGDVLRRLLDNFAATVRQIPGSPAAG